METSDDEPPKKCKRSFVDGWLNDERYKHWIRKVSSDDGLYYCTVCNKNFSCNASHISRHADSACHRNNLKENMSSSKDKSEKAKRQHTTVFKHEWLDIIEFKPWLREVPNDGKVCFCAICNLTLAAHLSHIRRHAESKGHVNQFKERSEMSDIDDEDFTAVDNETLLLFDERRKSAEIQFAALIAEKSISHSTAQEILTFFQHIGKEPNVLKNMRMGRTKCSNIISNVLCPVENKHIVNKLQKTKFSIFIDEIFDSYNKKWLTFFVRYVDPDTLEICSQLVKMINSDTKNTSVDELFHAFECEMLQLEIPIINIIALSCNNAPIMTGKPLSFKTKLEEICKHLLTFPCPCHSAALAANTACSKIPSFCDDFFEKVMHYNNSCTKGLEIFHEFCNCFQEKYHKIVKLKETRWLTHHACIKKLLDSWDTIRHFLQETIANDEIKSREYLLSLMDNFEMKAYFLFLKYVLQFFNEFSEFFQSTDTKIYLLQLKSARFLFQICQNFIKEEYLKGVDKNVNFSDEEILKDVNEFFVGLECEEYLNNLIIEGHADIVTTVRQNCLQFYLTAAVEIRERLPITHEFLKKLQVFEPFMSLLDGNRKTSFEHVSFITKTLGFDKDPVRKEWFALSKDLTKEEKQTLAKLGFDDMWKTILQRQLPNNTKYKYPNLRNVMSAVRSLPNSNETPDRTFPILTDSKSKKRNKLSSACVNATCVIKSAMKTRGETAVSMSINEEHLSRMLSDNLYTNSKNVASKKKSSSTINADAADVGPSSIT